MTTLLTTFNRIRSKLKKVNPCLQKHKSIAGKTQQRFLIENRYLGAGYAGIYIYDLDGLLVGGIRQDKSGVLWRIGRKAVGMVDCESITTVSYLMQTIEKFVGTKLTHEVFK